MKPIIVTYSNESYIAISDKIIKLTMADRNSVVPCGGFFFCEKLISHEDSTIWVTDVKLIARPKK
jgi:hypothetical protein